MASRSASGVSEEVLARAGITSPRSAAAKGSYYKARSKSWLEDNGYAVAHLERMMWIRKPQTKPKCEHCGEQPIEMFATKSDQFGADLLAMSKQKEQLIFVQVKFGDDNVMKARREFARFPFPSSALRWILVWELRARAPQIIDCSADTVESVAVRQKPKGQQVKLF